MKVATRNRFTYHRLSVVSIHTQWYFRRKKRYFSSSSAVNVCEHWLQVFITCRKCGMVCVRSHVSLCVCSVFACVCVCVCLSLYLML